MLISLPVEGYDGQVTKTDLLNFLRQDCPCPCQRDNNDRLGDKATVSKFIILTGPQCIFA